DCINVQSGLKRAEDRDRWVTASWTARAEKRSLGGFEVHLNVFATYTPSIIAEISVALRDMKVEISSVSTKENADSIVLNFGIRCSDADHANNIISALRKLKNVYDVTRGNG
ncbi:MAG: bifunctional (p)ppGpp synthetase/guanosine-3',5'-bis(diphosphate) 3'-pyrophosphohydrolase, partial [Clostridia bacterium]|nr:bifunctional (p)ppGpp synthetase/guanosine-3',5'-bis(diphosphate) 3'-pyrophosphohydrolase [Clostridia bacterium]